MLPVFFCLLKARMWLEYLLLLKYFFFIYKYCVRKVAFVVIILNFFFHTDILCFFFTIYRMTHFKTLNNKICNPKKFSVLRYLFYTVFNVQKQIG